MIHHQLTGLTTASRLECQTMQSRPLCYRSVYRILRTIPVARDLRCRVTLVVISIWQYTSAEMHYATNRQVAGSIPDGVIGIF